MHHHYLCNDNSRIWFEKVTVVNLAGRSEPKGHSQTQRCSHFQHQREGLIERRESKEEPDRTTRHRDWWNSRRRVSRNELYEETLTFASRFDKKIKPIFRDRVQPAEIEPL